VKLEDKERIRAIEEGFKAEGVVISEVGAWKNLLDPDGEKRKQNFDYVATRLALAEAVGAIDCVDIAGSYSPTVWYGPHPKNLSREFFRCDGGELPQADRPGEAEAREVLPGDDGLELARHGGALH